MAASPDDVLHAVGAVGAALAATVGILSRSRNNRLDVKVAVLEAHYRDLKDDLERIETKLDRLLERRERPR